MPLVFIGPKEVHNVFSPFRSYTWCRNRHLLMKSAFGLEKHQLLTLAQLCEYENLKPEEVLRKLGYVK